jgi:tetratricopeptide (TPR) repeat protein
LKTVLSPQDSPHPADKQLDDLYSAALNHLFPPTNRLARDNFKAIFDAIYVALGPLDEQALKELVGKGPGGIVSSLRSLQTRPSNDNRVTPATDLFHASFLDFIASKDRCDNVDFRIEPLEAHKKVVTLCIELLSKTFEDNSLTTYAELSAAVRYAIENWTTHAAECISKLDKPDIPSAWQTFLKTHGNRWGELMLSLIGGAIPVKSNSQGDDLLSWLNAEFLQLCRKRSLGRHLRTMLHINQVIVHFRQEGKVSVQRQLAFLIGNLFKYDDTQTNWTEAISLWPRENSGLVSSLTSLASLFYSQFSSGRSISDLDGAISVSQVARSLQPTGYITLNNLAIYLLAKFGETGSEKDLKDSIELHQVVAKIPPPRFDRAWSLNNLASSLHSRFEQSRSKKDLEKAIKLHEKALRLLSSDPDRPIVLGNLALCFETRFRYDWLLEPLDKAISLHEQALSERNNRHPDYPRRLAFLARSLELRVRYTGSKEDLDKAISLSRKVLDLYLARTNDTLSTARIEDTSEIRSAEGRVRNEFEAFPPDSTPNAEGSPERRLEKRVIQTQYNAIASTQTMSIVMQVCHTRSVNRITD